LNNFKLRIAVILLAPASPVKKLLQSHLLPLSLQHKIPLFGYGMGTIKKGAVVSYAGSRYNEGKQASRLVDKILRGTAPKLIPVEIPQQLELIVNRAMVKQLGLKLPRRVWRIADSIVDIEIKTP
jgi:putative tryptophan/tyrosine transport system substrate-binding protein